QSSLLYSSTSKEHRHLHSFPTRRSSDLERKQVGCDELLITPDKKTVGWSVYVENCCTSYPIPVAVVLYKNGNKTVISTPQTIWKDRKSTRLNSSHSQISYAVFCLKKKTN